MRVRRPTCTVNTSGKTDHGSECHLEWHPGARSEPPFPASFLQPLPLAVTLSNGTFVCCCCGLTMPLSRHSVGTSQETSSHATRQGTLSDSRLSSPSHSGGCTFGGVTYLVFTRMPGGVTPGDSGLLLLCPLSVERYYFPLFGVSSRAFSLGWRWQRLWHKTSDSSLVQKGWSSPRPAQTRADTREGQAKAAV